MKTIIYGTGQFWNNRKYLLPKDVEIIGYADSLDSNSTTVSGKLIDGKRIYTPKELENIDFDLLYICTDYFVSTNIFMNLKKFDIDLKKVRFLNRIQVTDNEWKYEVLDDGTIKSHIGNICIHEKKRTDIDTIAELFAQRTYGIDILPESIVIDFGMNVGIASLYFAQNDNVEKIYAFEPFPDTYKMALDNFELNKDWIKEKINPFCYAVTDKNEEQQIAVESDQPGWRSIFSKDEDAPQITIKCKSASDVVKKIVSENEGKRFVLKCDTEGSEFIIFKSLVEADLVKVFDSVVMEYHRNPSEIICALQKNGFRTYQNGTNLIGNITAFKLN